MRFTGTELTLPAFLSIKIEKGGLRIEKKQTNTDLLRRIAFLKIKLKF